MTAQRGITCAHEDLVEAGVPVHRYHTAYCPNASHQLQPACQCTLSLRAAIRALDLLQKIQFSVQAGH